MGSPSSGYSAAVDGGCFLLSASFFQKDDREERKSEGKKKISERAETRGDVRCWSGAVTRPELSHTDIN